MSFKRHVLSNMGQLFTPKLYGKNWPICPTAHPVGKLNDIVIPLNSQCINGLYIQDDICKLYMFNYDTVKIK